MTKHHHTARRMLPSVPLAFSIPFAIAILFALGSAPALAATIVANSENFEHVGSTEATVHAQIETDKFESTCYFEYGPTTHYGSKTASRSIAAESQVEARAQLNNLQPETEYHLRVVATDTTGAGGTTDGPDMTFTTFPTTGSALPDDRIYEMVSPPENDNADIYVPEASKLGGVPNAGETLTEYPFRAATDGDAVSYAGDPSFEGNGTAGENLGNEYLSTRTSGGWKTHTITPLGYTTAEYLAFSPDLSVGILAEGGGADKERPPLAPHGPTEYRDLYTRASSEGRYQALFTKTPPHRSPGEFGWLEEQVFVPREKLAQLPLYAGASSDFSHILFEADDALTTKTESEYSKVGNNLYDSINGELGSINVLPDGKLAPEATFGNGYLQQPGEPSGCVAYNIKRPNFSHVISADGSRIFWTDMKTGDLYVRENDAAPDATTLMVSEGGEFWTANSEGSKVFFTKHAGEPLGELYEYDVNTAETTDLAPGGEVQGVIGASEDGEYLYFVADGVLAGENTEGKRPMAKQPNLYLSHRGETSFIATLSKADNEVKDGCYYIGDWWPNLGDRTAEVTPSGQGVVFESVNSLTSYKSLGSREVYVYDAESGQISCASCNPSGESPSGTSYLPTGGRHAPTYQPQWISNDGSRVFFDTTEALVPHDTNGAMDVYEWERDGTSSCPDSKGCIYLLSGATSPGPSYFIDAGSSGDDVFFVTRAQLVPQDGNDDMNLYDAHVGGMPPPTGAQCTGTGCQGAPFPPPAFEAPASVTFNGIGNFPSGLGASPAKPAVKLKPKKARGCRKGYTKKYGKCVKSAKAKKARQSRRGK